MEYTIEIISPEKIKNIKGKERRGMAKILLLAML